MSAEQLLEWLIGQNVITQEEFDRKVQERKDQIEQDPSSPVTILKQRTVGMQDIDSFTLEQVLLLQSKVEQLEQRIAVLEGGTP